jgi:hypothetical protein
MSQSRKPPLKSEEAILASLFAPQRQWSLPTCTIESLINEEIRNHPERLIQIYMQMLNSDQFTLPSGCAFKQQPIVNDSTTIDLRNGGIGKDIVFKDIRSGDPSKIVIRKVIWQLEGIEYIESTDPTDQ